MPGYNSHLQHQHENSNKENVSTRSWENGHGTFNNKLIAYVNTGGSMECSASEHDGSSLFGNVLPGVLHTVDLQSFAIQERDDAALVAQLDRGTGQGH